MAQTNMTSDKLIKFWQDNGVEVSEKVIQHVDKLYNDSKLKNMGVFDLFDNYLDFDKLNNDLKPDANGVYPDYKTVILGFTTKKVIGSSFFSSANLAASKAWDMAALGILFDIVATNDQKFVNNQIEIFKLYISYGYGDPYIYGETLDGYLVPPTGYLKIFGGSLLSGSNLTPEKVKEIVINTYNRVYDNKSDYDASKHKLAFESYKQFEKNAESIEGYSNGYYTDIVLTTVNGYNEGLSFYNTGVDTIYNLKLIKKHLLSSDEIISIGTISPKNARVITSNEIQNIDAGSFDQIQFELFGFNVTLDYKKEIKPFVATVKLKLSNNDTTPGIAPEETNFEVFIIAGNINDEPFEIYIDYDDKSNETIQTTTHNGLKTVTIPHTYKQKGVFFPTITVRNINLPNIASISYDYLKVENPIKIKYPINRTFDYYAGINTIWTSDSVSSVAPNFVSHWDFEYNNIAFNEDKTGINSSWIFLPSSDKFSNNKLVQSTIALVASVNIDNTLYSDTAFQTINLFNPVVPKFNFTPLSKNVTVDVSSLPYQVNLDATTSVSATGKPLIYKWLVNQSDCGSTPKINYNITTPGKSIIKLILSDGTYSNEVKDSITLDFNVSYNSNQSINQLEYFFDSDPGFGKGFSIPVTFQNSVIMAISIISCDNLTTGLHRIYFRVKDSTGKWSVPQSQIVIIQHNSATANNITESEYFFDQDPGCGKGNKMSVSEGKDITINTVENIQNVSTGLHRIYFRVKDDLGNWSIPQSQIVIVGTSNNATNISKIDLAEYFFDTDPGIHNGFNLNIVSSDDLIINANLPINALTPGIHTIYFRVHDDAGRWSIPIMAQFEVEKGITTDVNSQITNNENIYKIYGGQERLTVITPNNDANRKYQLKVYSLSGVLILDKCFVGSQKTTIKKGLYVVEIIDNLQGNKTSQKILSY